MSLRFVIDWEERPGPESGQAAPIVTVTASGVHDVGRLLNTLARGNCEQFSLADSIARLLRYDRRRRGGLFTLKYLESHGGAVLGKGRSVDL
jgi:hypothetical protein